MKQHKYIRVAVAAVAAVLATACSDSDNWAPGPDTPADCQQVYFAEMSSYNIVVEPDDSRLIPVTIGRANTDKATTVSIIKKECPEGAIVPASVEFAADQQLATIYIDIENMPSKSKGTVSLALPDDMTSPYGAGTSSLTFDVNVSGAWIPVASEVTFSSGYYPDMTTVLYNLDGTDNFKLADFFGSGLDLVFVMNTPGNGWTYITPIKNFIDAEEAYSIFGWGEYPYDGGWFLYDTTLDEFPSWSPDGVTYPEISYAEFDDIYCYMNLISDADNNGYIYMSPYVTFADSTGAYLDLYFTFKTEFTPYHE